MAKRKTKTKEKPSLHDKVEARLALLEQTQAEERSKLAQVDAARGRLADTIISRQGALDELHGLLQPEADK